MLTRSATFSPTAHSQIVYMDAVRLAEMRLAVRLVGEWNEMRWIDTRSRTANVMEFHV
jgi:hypothetical protein